MEAWLATGSGDKVPIRGSFSMGRGLQNTLVLPGDARVSRRHALIHQQGADDFWLVDLGSSNGVVLNGRRVRQPMQLKNNDRIEVGSNQFQFLLTATTQQGDQQKMTGSATTTMLTIKESRTHPFWMLIADIEGFTPLSQSMPGDELGKMVGRWILSCKEVIEANGGLINKYLGDGFLAYWPSSNIPVENIVTTVAELKKLKGNQTFAFRLVIHFAEVTVDSGVSEGEDSLIGPQVNYIFRMEKLAGSLKEHCVASAAAAEKLRGHGTLLSKGHHPLSGFNGTSEFFAF